VQPAWRRTASGRRSCAASSAGEERGLRALYLLTMTAEHYFPRFGFEARRARRGAGGDRRDARVQSACPASASRWLRPVGAAPAA
jgi:amino-acid N-acetyltransferase